MCGEALLPVGDYWGTSFYACNSDCSVGIRIECPVPSEDQMLHREQISRAEWDAYVASLYGADQSQLSLLPRIHEVDMIYMDMLVIRGVQSYEYEECPSNAWHAPRLFGQPHLTRAAYYRLAPPLASNNSWLEVSHCASRIEAESSWFYVLRGSGIFVNVGTTIVFRDHPEAAEHFGIYGDVTNVPAAAAAAGYNSIQYWEHCEGCTCNAELMLTSSFGSTACSSAPEFRTGLHGSQPCTCQEMKMSSFGDGAGRPECITCSSYANKLRQNQPPDDD